VIGDSRPSREEGFTLVEMVLSGVLLVVVLTIVGNYLISANRTVTQSTAQQNDNAAAQRALGLLDANIRFACSMSINGGTLYVANSGANCTNPSQPACAEWSTSAGQLTERTSITGTAVVASGISGLSFTQSNQYNGLVSVQFTLKQPQDQASDTAGVTVNQTLTARNMSQSVQTGTVVNACVGI
jgi:type II secretory pathway component PulJ